MIEAAQPRGVPRRRQGTSRRFCCRMPSQPRSPWGRFQEPCPPALRPRPRLGPALLGSADWPGFWSAATHQLRSVGLQTRTLRLYRQVLRNFRDFLIRHARGTRPGCATPQAAREFLYTLTDRRLSWSRTVTHITALRTVFDKLADTALTEGFRTPRRPRRLYDVLSPEEVGRMVKAAGSTRDRLAVLLFYGCGLKTSELCALRWKDVDMAGGRLTVPFAGGTRERELPLPRNTLVLLQAEACMRHGTDPVFPGLAAGQPICARTAERIVSRAARKAGLAKEVCCTTLRRSYAVQCLRDHMDVCRLQQNLGHKYLQTTMDYYRYLLPRDVRSPAIHFTDPLASASPFVLPVLGAGQPSGP